MLVIEQALGDGMKRGYESEKSILQRLRKVDYGNKRKDELYRLEEV